MISFIVMKKKICCSAILFILVSGAFILGMGLPALASGTPDGNWNSYTIAPDISDSTYIIDSAEELAWVAEQVNSGVTTFSGYTINVTQDIDLSAHYWTPIGTSSTITSNSFQGTFDGNGHKISGLSIGTAESPSTLVYNGFFGYAKNSSIKNVGLENVAVYTAITDMMDRAHVGGLVGYLEEASALENCYVTGYLESKKLSDRGASYTGGVVGELYGELMVPGNATVKNCYSSCVVRANGQVGGFCASIWSALVINCYSTGLVNGVPVPATSQAGAAGFVAKSESTIYMNSFSRCDVTGTMKYKAGFAAYTYSCTYINNYATGCVGGTPGAFFDAQWSNTLSNNYWPDSPYSLAQMQSDEFTELLNTNASDLAPSEPKVVQWQRAAAENGGFPQLIGVGDFSASHAPKIFNLTVNGRLTEGHTLTASYDYSDMDNRAESGTTYQWYRATDASGEGATAIPDATGTAYTLTSDDIGHYLRIEITPSNGIISGAPQKSIYTGVIEQQFAGGLGTPDDPYLISTLGHLKSVSDCPGAYFRLDADINTDALDQSLCSSSSPFTGNFNGNNKIIKIEITDASANGVGLFSFIGSGGTVYDLKVEGSAAGSASNVGVGGLAGYSEGTIERCTSAVAVSASGDTVERSSVGGLIGYNAGRVLDSSATGTVTAAAASENIYAGGLIGYNTEADVSGCFATGQVVSGQSAGGTDIGGLIGYNYEAGIDNCYATGAVESDVSSLSRIGGLTGYNKYGTISNCHAEGNVTGAGYVYMGGLAGQSYSENTKGSGTSVVTILASITDSYATGNVVATSNPEDCPIGGLVGANSTTYTDSLQNVTYGIINCYATGSVSETGGEAYIGGLVGFNQAVSIQYCFSAGDVSASSGSAAGGFVGYNRSQAVINCCYATGDVLGIDVASDSNTYMGGFVGYLYSGALQDCYSGGAAEGANAYAGGFLGRADGTAANCYWNTDKTAKSIGNSTTVIGTGLTTVQMTGDAAKDNMSFDFTTPVWTATANDASHWYYPQLALFADSTDDTVKSLSLTSASFAAPSVTSVTVSPSTAEVEKGKQQAFTAVVAGNNAPAQAVVWSVTGHTGSGTYISSSGILSVAMDESAASLTITAISTIDGSKSGTATVTVKSSSAFSEGTGTSNEPFIITNRGQMEAVGNYPNACFRLEADITDSLTAPIGSAANPFVGSFDGNGKSISVNIANSPDTHVGLFAFIGTVGQVSNLTVNGNVSAICSAGEQYIGALAGQNNGKISGCSSSASVTAAGGKVHLGGLVGYNYSVNSSKDQPLVSKAEIESCSATGNVSASNILADSGIGGLVGTNTTLNSNRLDPNAPVFNVTNSYATGDITVAANLSSETYIGGLVGYNRVVSIRDCYATGAVNATNRSSAGGLVGHVRTEAVVERCFASGDVLVTDCGSVSGNTCLGGLIGYLNSGTVNDSYATGDVVGTNIASTGSQYFGGLLGYIYESSVKVNRSYTAGQVSGENTALGGLVGKNRNKAKTIGPAQRQHVEAFNVTVLAMVKYSS